MRITQPKGNKGSLKWIQYYINEKRELFDEKILNDLKIQEDRINWKSPIKTDEYSEYRDLAFLKLLGLEEFEEQLKAFWPKRGPQWDALAITKKRKYMLFEAKANIPEILSSCQAKHPDSIKLINKSIETTKRYLGKSKGKNWLDGFYQYANRISHLYFFRKVCNIDAHLIFVYFCNDKTHIPTTVDQWKGAIQLQKSMMALNSHKLKQFVHELFIDIES
ncbi:MAG: hypothetical protein FP816_16105 [Desulfobacteraceae bacterium]|nr:hypothetical protein [Desulfobacteraceae bacterium]MBU4000972.1 hypothetical protein [Pseudomonadota bacterium]